MAGPGVAVIGTAKQWHSRAAIGFDGKGDAANCCERPSQATEWQGSATKRNGGVALRRAMMAAALIAMFGKGFDFCV